MKMLQGMLLLGLLVCGGAFAEDFSVVIAGSPGPHGIGTGLNLYATTKKGVKLVEGSPYVLPASLLPPSSYPWGPALLAVTADQNYAYAVYYSLNFYPAFIVQFAITAKGLEYRWMQPLTAGNNDLGNVSISTVGDGVGYYSNPVDYSFTFTVFDVSGNGIIYDDGGGVVSGHVDPHSKFYYSCRTAQGYGGGPGGGAGAVAVYALPFDSAPLAISTDPLYVQSVCN
jgi:hypothetical protein